MEGILESKEGQIIVAGTFKGNVIAKSLIIESSSTFNGNINAEHVRVEGNVNGDITNQIQIPVITPHLNDFSLSACSGKTFDVNAFSNPFRLKYRDMIQLLRIQDVRIYQSTNRPWLVSKRKSSMLDLTDRDCSMGRLL